VIPAASTPCFLLAFGRASAFAATAPLAASGAVPKLVRASLGLVLTFVVATHMAHVGACGARPSGLAFATNAAVGFSFGIAASAVAAAASAAGSMIDAAMASQALGREAVLGGSGGPFARIFALGFALAFFATGSMAYLCRRFVDASSAVPATPSIAHVADLAKASTEAALAIAAPAICAQVLATIVAAFVARAAPRINGLMLASPAASALVLIGLFAAAPEVLAHLAALARAASNISVP
jgi:flagellar biosynthesis protein FliR